MRDPVDPLVTGLPRPGRSATTTSATTTTATAPADEVSERVRRAAPVFTGPVAVPAPAGRVRRPRHA